MDYEVRQEVDYIVSEVAEHLYGRETGVRKVREAIKAIGRGSERSTIVEAIKYFEEQCDRKNI